MKGGGQGIDFSHVHLGLRNTEMQKKKKKAENSDGIFKDGAAKGMGNTKLETTFGEKGTEV